VARNLPLHLGVMVGLVAGIATAMAAAPRTDREADA
jgi:gas vesicle protein